MKNLLIKSVIYSFFLLAIYNTPSLIAQETQAESRKTIAINTTHGTLVVELYNETPLHRDNFVKRVQEKRFDSILFHRVIQSCMIQAGESDRQNDAMNNGDTPTMIPAEFHPNLFHKKGALAAARSDNPERASSDRQFYIVQGKVMNDCLLTHNEERINGWLAKYYMLKNSTYKPLTDSLNQAINDRNFERYQKWNDSINKLAKNFVDFDKYKIPPAHISVYKTVGCTPHLDHNYNFFVQVIKRFEGI